jgi:hypothetical protein
LIAAAKNKKAGALIAAGTFLFLLAIGINMIYSIQTVCLDTDPLQCFTGYDTLTESQKLTLTPGLYIIAFLVVIAGALIWFVHKPVLQAPSS